jgi:hypothetical protein
MTSYAWPTDWLPAACTEPVLRPNVGIHESPYTGSQQSIDELGERFMQSLRLVPTRGAVASGARQAFFNRLRGAGFVTVHALARPQPMGTQRATPTLSANVAQGAASLPLTGVTNGATLLAGDMLGVSGQLFQVAADVTFSGTTGTVATTNRARAALSSAASVTWDKPTADWRVANLVEILLNPGMISEPVDLELIQVWIA